MRKKKCWTGWKYPCEGESFIWIGGILEVTDVSMAQTKEDLEDDCDFICRCGKGCKPIKVKITEEKV